MEDIKQMPVTINAADASLNQYNQIGILIDLHISKDTEDIK